MAGLENSQTHWQRSTDIYCACRFQLACAWQAILSTVRKKAVQQVFLFFFFFFLFYVQHQLHPTALFVCTTMRSIYIVLCIAARRRYHNTFQDIHKQRDYSIFFFSCFTIFLQKYPPAMKSCCFCKHQAMS